MSKETIKPTEPVLIKDLGMQFPTETSKRKSRYGIYLCSCGVEFRAGTEGIKSKSIVSCGCYNKLRTKESNTKHGLRDHPLYAIWSGMITRTTNTKHKHFKDYGGKGITVCERWLIFINFYNDMVSTWTKGLSIDRKDNNLGYYPENCRWANNTIQSRNTRIIMSTNTSGYRGVSFRKDTNKWKATITVNKKTKSLGSFLTSIEEAKAYDNYIIANNLEHTINNA